MMGLLCLGPVSSCQSLGTLAETTASGTYEFLLDRGKGDVMKILDGPIPASCMAEGL